MKKSTLGAKNCLYPMPLTLIGATVNGEPNYSAIANVGIMDFCTLSVSIIKSYYTPHGIKEQENFSVNIPSTDMVKEAEYCGLVSGKRTDKSQLFTSFYGKLETAPMIQECPINMECRLVKTIDFPRHEVFVGEIVESYCNEEHLQNNSIDFAQVQPILFVMDNTGYWRIGEEFAKAWNVGVLDKS
jgi:flavin reductase (DIM6/NTAB) family NADH-FMN oxidoreductase RutF